MSREPPYVSLISSTPCTRVLRLAHRKQSPPLGPPCDPRHSPSVGSWEEGVSHQRGTLVSLGRSQGVEADASGLLRQGDACSRLPGSAYEHRTTLFPLNFEHMYRSAGLKASRRTRVVSSSGEMPRAAIEL